MEHPGERDNVKSPRLGPADNDHMVLRTITGSSINVGPGGQFNHRDKHSIQHSLRDPQPMVHLSSND